MEIIKILTFIIVCRLHDQIINVNGVDCQRVHRSSVYAAVVNGGGWVQMTVRRRRSGGRSLHTVHLHCPHTAHHGLTLHTGVYIANILPGSPAARESNLAVGDRVLNVSISCSVFFFYLIFPCIASFGFIFSISV